MKTSWKSKSLLFLSFALLFGSALLLPKANAAFSYPTGTASYGNTSYGYGTFGLDNYSTSTYLNLQCTNNASLASYVIGFADVNNSYNFTWGTATTTAIGNNVYQVPNLCISGAGGHGCNSVWGIDVTLTGTAGSALDVCGGSIAISDSNYVPPPPVTGVNFVFPTDGTSTGQFNPYVISVSGDAESVVSGARSDNYITQIKAIACPQGTTITNPNCLAPVYQHSQLQTGSNILAQGITVPNNGFNFDFATNQTIYATAVLQDITTPSNALGLSDSISYTYLTIPNSSPSSTLNSGGIYLINTPTGNGTFTQATTTGNTQIVTPYLTPSSTQPTISNWCPPDGSLLNPVADLGYGICQAIQFAFNPNVLPITQTYFQSSLTQLQSVPPFVAFYQLASSTENGLNGFSSSTNNGLTVSILGYDHGNFTSTQLFTINSTTFFGGFSSSTNNVTNNVAANSNLETYIGAWLWIGAGIKILYIFIT